MNEERKIWGMRIVSKDRLEKMSSGSLSAYKKKVKRIRRNLYYMNKTVCCTLCMEVLYEDYEYTEEEKKEIKTIDWLYNEIKRIKKEREKENGHIKQRKLPCKRPQQLSPSFV